MKILIDIGHPAHVHYFRNFSRIMKDRGHDIFIIAKNRNITHKLLDHYGISYVTRNDYPKSVVGKLLNIPITDIMVYRYAKKISADILIGFSGTHIAHAATLLRKPSIVIDDTDHAHMAHVSYRPFAKTILTPSCFYKDFGKKHIRFDGYMELCYLARKYFNPDPSVLDLLNIKPEEKYVILRFVSWSASHDVGHTGFTNEMKYRIFKYLKQYAKVFISSENPLPDILERYKIKIPTYKMHDALFYSSLLFGESATMASECACLGTPSIFFDNTGRSYTDEEGKKYGLVYNYSDPKADLDESLKLCTEILKKTNGGAHYMAQRSRLLEDKIDVTRFLVWFVERYPESVEICKGNIVSKIFMDKQVSLV
jgi:uncharacterized protein